MGDSALRWWLHDERRGPRLVRWAAVEAVSRNHTIEPTHDIYARVGQRRGVIKGRVAAARKLLALVFDGPRDLEVRQRFIGADTPLRRRPGVRRARGTVDHASSSS